MTYESQHRKRAFKGRCWWTSQLRGAWIACSPPALCETLGFEVEVFTAEDLKQKPLVLNIFQSILDIFESLLESFRV